MSSSVVETRPSGGEQARSSSNKPRPDFRTPSPQHHPSQTRTHKTKHGLALAPAEGWFAMLLVAVAAYSVVFSIISANWVGHSFILIFSTVTGLFIGLAVAKARYFPQAILHLAACLVGHWLSIWLTSAIAFQISWLLLLGNLRSALVNGMSNGSDMVFLFYLCFLCFFLGYFGAWLVFRAHLPWLVALVYCSILLVTLNSINEDQPLLVVTLLAALILLIARIQLSTQIESWISQGLHTDRSWVKNITWRVMQTTSIFVLITLLLSWMLPVLAEPVQGATFWDNLDNAWTNITHGQFSVTNPGQIVQTDQAPTNFFGDSLAITGSVNLPAGEVLNYTTTAQGQPRYLEGFSFDHFDGHNWTALTFNISQNYGANAILPIDTRGNFNQVTISVTVVKPPAGTKYYIFAPAQPSNFDVSTTLYGNGITSAWTQQNPSTPGEHYQATSMIPAFTPQDLSSIPLPQTTQFQNLWLSDENHAELKSYYTSTPNLPPLVLATARQWTAGATNAYDAMKMLEARLSDKTQFTYSVVNSPVPTNVDAVSWLLTTRRGFCTYYATAMTMMARQLGMPARIVNGFTQGNYDARRKVWVVNGNDAHSWVQVYFPGYGWVNFDPTPGYSLNTTSTPLPSASPTPAQPPAHLTPTPPGKRPAPVPTSTSHSGTHSGVNNTSPDGTTHQNLLVGLSLATLLCSIIVLLVALFTFWWRRLYSSTSFVSGMYWRVCRLASWAGLPPRNWQTPYEYSRSLGRLLPSETAPMRRLTEHFVHERWAATSQVPRTLAEDDLARLWPHLRNMLFRLLLLKFKSRK